MLMNSFCHKGLWIHAQTILWDMTFVSDQLQDKRKERKNDKNTIHPLVHMF